MRLDYLAQEDFFMRNTSRTRALGFMALLALLAILAFAACAPRHDNQAGGNNGPTTSQNSGNQNTTTTTTTDPNIQAVENADNSIQTSLPSMQSASSNANTDYSSQDNPTVP